MKKRQYFLVAKEFIPNSENIKEGTMGAMRHALTKDMPYARWTVYRMLDEKNIRLVRAFFKKKR